MAISVQSSAAMLDSNFAGRVAHFRVSQIAFDRVSSEYSKYSNPYLKLKSVRVF